jgi:hypothetical protein
MGQKATVGRSQVSTLQPMELVKLGWGAIHCVNCSQPVVFLPPGSLIESDLELEAYCCNCANNEQFARENVANGENITDVSA